MKKMILFLLVVCGLIQGCSTGEDYEPESFTVSVSGISGENTETLDRVEAYSIYDVTFTRPIAEAAFEEGGFSIVLPGCLPEEFLDSPGNLVRFSSDPDIKVLTMGLVGRTGNDYPRGTFSYLKAAPGSYALVYQVYADRDARFYRHSTVNGVEWDIEFWMRKGWSEFAVIHGTDSFTYTNRVPDGAEWIFEPFSNQIRQPVNMDPYGILLPAE